MKPCHKWCLLIQFTTLILLRFFVVVSVGWSFILLDLLTRTVLNLHCLMIITLFTISLKSIHSTDTLAKQINAEQFGLDWHKILTWLTTFQDFSVVKVHSHNVRLCKAQITFLKGILTYQANQATRLSQVYHEKRSSTLHYVHLWH
jgi:hypothetical protein